MQRVQISFSLLKMYLWCAVHLCYCCLTSLLWKLAVLWHLTFVWKLLSKLCNHRMLFLSWLSYGMLPGAVVFVWWKAMQQGWGHWPGTPTSFQGWFRSCWPSTNKTENILVYVSQIIGESISVKLISCAVITLESLQYLKMPFIWKLCRLFS